MLKKAKAKVKRNSTIVCEHCVRSIIELTILLDNLNVTVEGVHDEVLMNQDYMRYGRCRMCSGE